MVIDQGMNVAEVKALAAAIAAAADRLELHAQHLEKLVLRSAWRGATSNRFRNEWWPRHRTSLVGSVAELHQFARIAAANAAEQEDASAGDTISVMMGTRGPTGTHVGGSPAESPGGLLERRFEFGLFAASKAHDLADLRAHMSYFRTTDIHKFFSTTETNPKLGKIAAVGTLWDGFKLGRSVGQGNADQSIRGGIDVAFDLVGTKVPNVAAGKAAWDIGWQVGKGGSWAFDKLGGNDALIDSVISKKYGGSLTPSTAQNLATRYDGPKGFATYLGDSVTSSGDVAKGVWKKVFG